MAVNPSGCSPRQRLRQQYRIALALSFLVAAVIAPARAMPPGSVASSLTLARGPVVDPIAARCIGSRRDYRDFNHCWHRRAKTRRGIAYCSRICR